MCLLQKNKNKNKHTFSHPFSKMCCKVSKSVKIQSGYKKAVQTNTHQNHNKNNSTLLQTQATK